MSTLAAGEGPVVSGPVLIILLAGGFLIYSLGFAVARMRRARVDLLATRAAVKGLRRGFWGSVGLVFRAGVIVAVALIVLSAWVVRDVRNMDDSADTTPSPAPSAVVRHAR